MTTAVDPVVAALAKALYGDSVSPEDFAKSIDPADVHIEGTVTKPRRKLRALPVGQAAQSILGKADPAAPSSNRKKLAAGLVAGAGIEALAAKDTIEPLVQGIKNVEPAVHYAETVGAKIKALKPLAVGAPGKVLPATAGPGTKTALQAGNFGVGLGAAKELVDPKKKPAQPGQAVGKGVRVSVKVLNPADLKKVPSLRARRPAGSPAMSKSFEAEGEISKLDADKRQVFGWANVSKINGQVVRDRQGDEIHIEELEKAAYDYVLDSRIGGDMHDRVTKFAGAPRHTSDIIESMVFTPEKIEKLGLPHDFPQGWWVGMQVNDETTWQLIKSGARTGFSIHGTGTRVPLEKAAPARDPQDEQRDREAAHRVNTGGSYDPKKLRHLAAVPDRPAPKKVTLAVRVGQAKNPPPVRRQGVSSTAVRSIGYQRQTRKLDVEMVSRPGQPYSYRVKPKVAAQVVDAPSKGKAYNQVIRNKTKHHDRYTVGDRARLFVSPQ